MSNTPFAVTLFERDHPARKFDAFLSDTPPTPRQGGGGWQTITLPKRSAVSVWQGRDGLLQMDLPLRIGTNIGDPAAVFLASTPLMKMWRPDNPAVQPPVVKLSSPGSAVPFKTLPWTVLDFQWGDAIANPKAQRVMQKLTVTLQEFRADERLQIHKARKQPAQWKVTRARKGDTLVKIAHAHGKNWQDVARAQSPPITDPRQLQVGQELIIPL